MATRKLLSPITGKMVEAEVVAIERLEDTPIMIHLADSSVLRLKVDVIEVCRYAGEWDKEGHPMYNVKSGNILAILDSPEHLRNDDSEDGTVQ